jgi:hypothetical protein
MRCGLVVLFREPLDMSSLRKEDFFVDIISGFFIDRPYYLF